MRVILEGGGSDTEHLELADDQPPPATVEPAGESYGPVLDYYDQHMRDITGRWRYRLRVEYRPMKPAHSTINVKP
jgi:hypothetical protein